MKKLLALFLTKQALFVSCLLREETAMFIMCLPAEASI